MKFVIGLFTIDDSVKSLRRLVEHGFSYEDISMMSSVSEIPFDLEEAPEDDAVSGAAVGVVAGGTLGALGTLAASVIPGFEAMFVSGLLSTAVGGTIGGYLGSLYGVRAESQEKLNIHEALGEGKVLLVVKVDDANEETAVSVMEQNQGDYIETHTLSAAEAEALLSDD